MTNPGMWQALGGWAVIGLLLSPSLYLAFREYLKMRTPEEQQFIDTILARVVPLTEAEVDDLLETWKKWAWFSAHDEDCKGGFQGEHGTHLRLIVTLQKAWEAEKQKEETTK